MSWLYVPGLEACPLESDSPSANIERGGPSTPTTLRETFWPGASLESRLEETSGNTTSDPAPEPSASSRRASLVNLGPPPESEPAWMTSDGSGPTLHKSSESAPRGSYSSRTVRESISAQSSRAWMHSGLMRRGTVSAQPRAELRIAVKGRSYWPTPTASTYGSNRGGAAGRTGKWRPSLRGLFGGPENPRFLEWMMGLPIGWCSTGSLETALFQRWQHAHSSLWRDD